MPPLKVFNLGQLGVNVRESPLHLQDGELTQAQNADLSKDGAEDALVKRGGIEEFSTSVLAGAAVGMVSVPLPDLFPTFARPITIDRAGTGTRASSTGATWAGLGGLSALDRWEPNDGPLLGLPFFSDRLYYPISACAGLQTFDGVGVTAATPLPQTVTIPSRPDGALTLVINAVVRDGAIWWLARYNAGGAPANVEVVFKHDPVAGTFTEVGSRFCNEGFAFPGFGVTGSAIGLDVWLGRVYVQTKDGAAAGSGVQVWSAAVGDAAWTLEDTISLATIGNIVCGSGVCAADDGDLYAAGMGGTNARLRKRTSAGTWSTVFTNGATGKIVPVHVAGDRVLIWHSTGGTMKLRESLNGGTSFSDVFTAASPGHAFDDAFAFSRLVRFKGLEFLVYTEKDGATFPSKVLRNNSGWGVVDTYGTNGSASGGLLSGVLV